MYRKSILIAAAIVAAGALLVALDPYLMAAYRSVAPDWEALNVISEVLREAFEPLIVFVGIIVYVALSRVERLTRFLALTGMMLTQATVVSLLKKLFSRPRPLEIPDAVVFFGPRLHDAYSSFPGGHAAAVFALATILAAWHPRWRYALYAVAFVVAWSRVHLNAHFIGDCFIGGWLGFWIGRCFVVYPDGRSAPQPVEKDSAGGGRIT